jgi:hypothetical protein
LSSDQYSSRLELQRCTAWHCGLPRGDQKFAQRLVENFSSIVYSKSFEKGVHFPGWERLEGVAEGLGEIFGKEGGAAGVDFGRGGY